MHEEMNAYSLLLVIRPAILHVTRSHKRTKDVTRRVCESPNAFGGRAPLGERERCSPDPLAAIGEGVLLLKGRKGRRREERGKERGRDRKGERKRGEKEGEGRIREEERLLFI